jgi:hypothetical protein
MKKKNRTLGKIAILLQSITLTLVAGLAVAGPVQAQSINWLDKDVYAGSSEISWYQPKLAGNANGDFVVVGYQSGTTLGPIAYWEGYNPWNETSLDGAGSSTEYALGAAPSAAMVSFIDLLSYSAVIDVHQGGQDNGAALWSHVAVYASNPYGSAPIGVPLNFTDGVEYDIGYNATVAADPDAEDFSPGGVLTPMGSMTTVVEVHQAAAGISNLWYHVGYVYVTPSGVPTLDWGPSYQFDGGYLPSVAVCNGVAIEVHEGSPGSLWYSVGKVSGNSISWSGSSKYDNGYAPSISCGITGYVVEVHQATSPAIGQSSALWYRVAPFTSAEVSWTTSTEYDTGCNPTVAFSYTLANTPQYLAEAHSKACGRVGPLVYDYGLFELP